MPYSSRRSSTGAVAMVVVAIVALVIGGFFVMSLYNNATKKIEHVKVLDKARECDSSGSGDSARIECNYVVHTDKGPYYNKDAWTMGKTNSASLQSRLLVDHCYEVTTVGFRVAIYGSRQFRNIITATEEPCGAS